MIWIQIMISKLPFRRAFMTVEDETSRKPRVLSRGSPAAPRTGASSTADRAFMNAGQFRPKNPGTYGRGQHKQSNWFKYSQIIGPLLPIPVGCYLLYKAICSFNRNPPPIATDSATVMARPLYGEPVYQRISFAPSTIARNMTARGEGR